MLYHIDLRLLVFGFKLLIVAVCGVDMALQNWLEMLMTGRWAQGTNNIMEIAVMKSEKLIPARLEVMVMM